tara:strand:- start:1262 stop:2332 length:1071 start_codon:yes stop_codon:yes gene_type:complete
MKIDKFIENIRKYSLISFLIPLIVLNLCLLIYKTLGDIHLYPNLKWDEKEIEYPFEKFISSSSKENLSFTNCPAYHSEINYITKDNKIIQYDDVESKKKYLDDGALNIKSALIKSTKRINNKCVKNHKFLYFLLSNLSPVEKVLIIAKNKNKVGYPEIENPYFYGEVSISRTARDFPNNFIFKPFIVLSAIFLFIYWKNNFNLFNELYNKKVIEKYSIIFFYFGFLACVFLTLHAIFLGVDLDSKIFKLFRRIVIVLFIIFELVAQILLAKNLLKFKDNLINYINPVIVYLKVFFVIAVLIITIVVFYLLTFNDLSGSTKHILEWNYFSALLFYYLLSRLLWKKKIKTQVHTPEGA